MNLKRILAQNKKIKANELALRQEIKKLNNILKKKYNENLELIKKIIELKRKNYYLRNDYNIFMLFILNQVTIKDLLKILEMIKNMAIIK